jgi:hypothetical protein
MEILRFIKNLLQSTRNKEQSSISHTPEGTNTDTAGLSETGEAAIAEAQDASISRTDLCRRPIAGGGGIPLSSAAVSWIT